MYECEIEIINSEKNMPNKIYTGLMPLFPEVGKTFFAYLKESPRYIYTDVVISVENQSLTKFLVKTPSLTLVVINKGRANVNKDF